MCTLLQAVSCKLRDEGKTVYSNQHWDPVGQIHWWGDTHPEEAEPVHQPGHGSCRDFLGSRAEARATVLTPPVRGKIWTAILLLPRSFLNKAFWIRQHPSTQHSSSKYLLHKHGISQAISWEIFPHFFSWGLFSPPFSRGTTFLSKPGNTVHSFQHVYDLEIKSSKNGLLEKSALGMATYLLQPQEQIFC